MLNFSLNARKRVPSKVATLLRNRQIPQLSQHKHNIASVSVNPEVIIVNVEDHVKDVIVYEIGEQSNVILDPQPSVEEPVIETLSSTIVNVNQVNIPETIVEIVEENINALETVEAVEPVETVEAVEPVETVEAVEPVETTEAVETVETTEAVETVETTEAVEVDEAEETPETPEATEAPEVTEAVADTDTKKKKKGKNGRK
jgi:hypothetical protein